jgi:nucleoside-diphosphate-sugar epimerase
VRSSDTVLVTGATGFVGRSLLARLRGSGARVAATSRNPPAGADGDHRACDLEDEAAVQRLFDEVRPSHVIHLASLVTGSRDLAAVVPTFRANLAAAVHLLAAAARIGSGRVVLAGSMEELPADEPARYPYAAAKRAASEYGRFFHRAFGLSVVTLRIGMVYGPGERRTTGFIPHVVLSQLAGSRPRIASGKRSVDWVFVDDVAEACEVAAIAPDVGGAVLEIGTGTAVSMAEVVARLTAITGGPEPEIGALPDRAGDIDLAMDAATTARMTGWAAKVRLDEGLPRTVEWFRTERAAGRL